MPGLRAKVRCPVAWVGRSVLSYRRLLETVKGRTARMHVLSGVHFERTNECHPQRRTTKPTFTRHRTVKRARTP